MALRNNLRHYRKLHGLTQSEMGQLIGITESGYSLLEHGKRNPTLERALVLADLFGCSVHDIFLPSIMTSGQAKSENN